MPQLDTSTWLLVIFLMIMALFCVYQLKMLNQKMISIIPTTNNMILTTKTQLPWEKKWTKIYLPHSSPLQF
uniref:ATP synthase complex subunit 8 n=1 Tax=Echymipera rufescens australis TaxID=164528 RepID=Q32UR2_ECHRU|nr:ATP synthase F0 subunit 8 [Echymipera rufescens australis]AAV50086.1 ATPase subunit 8 [Echymipera rufescens australis]